MRKILILCGVIFSALASAEPITMADLEARKIELGHYEIYPIIAPEAKGFISIFKQEMIDNLGVELLINGKQSNFSHIIFGERAKTDPEFYKEIDKVLHSFLPQINDSLVKNKVKHLENIVYTNKSKLTCKDKVVEVNLLEKRADIHHELYGDVETLVSQEIMVNGKSVLNIEMLNQKRKYQSSQLAIVGSTESCKDTFFVILKNAYYGAEKKINYEYKLVYFNVPRK